MTIFRASDSLSSFAGLWTQQGKLLPLLWPPPSSLEVSASICSLTQNSACKVGQALGRENGPRGVLVCSQRGCWEGWEWG